MVPFKNRSTFRQTLSLLLAGLSVSAVACSNITQGKEISQEELKTLGFETQEFIFTACRAVANQTGVGQDLIWYGDNSFIGFGGSSETQISQTVQSRPWTQEELAQYKAFYDGNAQNGRLDVVQLSIDTYFECHDPYSSAYFGGDKNDAPLPFTMTIERWVTAEGQIVLEEYSQWPSDSFQ